MHTARAAALQAVATRHGRVRPLPRATEYWRLPHEASAVSTDFLFTLTPADYALVRDAAVSHRRADKGAAHPDRGGVHADKGLLFARVDPIEPLKQDVANPERVRAFLARRRALAVVVDRADRQVYEIEVVLATGSVAACRHCPGVRPLIPVEDMIAMEDVCKSSPAVHAALRARGVSPVRPELLQVDPISSGPAFGDAAEAGRRLSTGFVFLLEHPLDNGYAHPVAGLSVTVDLDAMEVFRVHDYDPAGKVPIPRTDYSDRYGGTRHQWYSALLASQPRMASAKPLEVVQRDGPSFELSGVAGRHVRWLEWDFDIGFNYREGLTLHRMTFCDPTAGTKRPVCFRASVAEMAVPYASSAWGKHRQNPVDCGEYGLGALANSLTNGCDCLGEIRYLDAVLSDGAGNPRVIPSAICLHEEDDGLLFKHFDMRTEHSEVRRRRILVVSFIATVGNYEYAFYWKFARDGTFDLDVKLTGIIHTDAKHPANEKYGAEVQPGVLGTIHSHFFCARLDMTVDGARNRVTELDYVAEEVPGPSRHNAFGNAVFVRETPLRSEREAARQTDARAERTWSIGSATQRNAMGRPTGYRLVPRAHVLPLQSAGHSVTRRRLAFMDHHLWVTPFDPVQRHPAGDYPNQAEGPIGLPVWTQANRKVWDEDIVVWHVFGVHHKPRIEDWPVMSCVTTGFTLQPYGFFDKNPAMLLPAPAPRANHCADPRPTGVGAAAASAAGARGQGGGACCQKAKL